MDSLKNCIEIPLDQCLQIKKISGSKIVIDDRGVPGSIKVMKSLCKAIPDVVCLTLEEEILDRLHHTQTPKKIDRNGFRIVSLIWVEPITNP
jgi:hypothetical protein